MHRFIANNNISFKRTFFISVGLGVSVGSVYWFTHIQENVTRYHLAYQMIPKLIQTRKWKHQIVGNNNSDDLNNSNVTKINQDLTIVSSNESITILDAANPENVLVVGSNKSNNNSTSSYSSLGTFSKAHWPEFLNGQNENNKNIDSCDDEFFVTIGVRKAFGANSAIHKLGFTHAVVLVESRRKKNRKGNEVEKNFAIFGYNAGKLSGKNPHFMLNDMNNEGVARIFTFYNELTIKLKGREEARKFFERMESAADKPYKVFTCNCFSPIFTAMIEASESRSPNIQVPEHFMESLTIVVPTEQNLGFGMSSNAQIKPYAELASAAINVSMKRKLLDKSRTEEVLSFKAEEKSNKK